MRVRPIKKWIVVEVTKVRKLVERGFVLPDTVAEWLPPQQGRVVAVGREVTKTGVGRRILFGLEAGTEFEELLILHEDNIVCEMD